MNSTHIIPTQTKEHRKHIQSKDCWCNPVVIPPDYDWDNDPDGLVAKAMEEENIHNWMQTKNSCIM